MNQSPTTTRISATTRRRLDIQGFGDVSDQAFAEVMPWHRLAFAICAIVAAAGTYFASPILLGLLAVVAALSAASPVHPFDLIYNHGIRHIRGTGPLPQRGTPVRLACGMGSVWLIGVIIAFLSGQMIAGYVFGGIIVASATLVATIDVCVPSMVYQAIRSKRAASAKSSSAVAG